MSRIDKLERRRKRKFKKHSINIRNENVSEERRVGNKSKTIHFNFAVYAGKEVIGRTVKSRHALKRAHQHIRNITPTGSRI